MGTPVLGNQDPEVQRSGHVERDINGEEVNTNKYNELWGSDPNCIHDIQPQLRGGVKCVKCKGWFCY